MAISVAPGRNLSTLSTTADPALKRAGLFSRDRNSELKRDRRNAYVAEPARSGQLLPSKGHRSKNDTRRRSWAIQLIVSIGCLLARSGSIFERELGNSGFVELA